MWSQRPRPEQPGPGQESVWDYPRPPRVEPTGELVEVQFGGSPIVRTTRGLRVLETSHPPTYYLPIVDIEPGVLQPVEGGSFCEWKGPAAYFDVSVAGRVATRAAWHYPDPSPRFTDLREHVAIYPGLMDTCTVDGEVVRPQPGGFYGGWVTTRVVGPFKGEPGTMHW